MRQADREAVLHLTAFIPMVTLNLGVSYLRMKRQVKRARRAFYRELVGSGLPREEAARLADEYASAVSVRRILRSMDWWPG